jgi:hypothetical protein
MQFTSRPDCNRQQVPERMKQLQILRCQVWKSHMCLKWPISVQDLIVVNYFNPVLFQIII